MLGTSPKPHVARYPLIANAHKAHLFRPLQPTVAWSINTEQSKSNRKEKQMAKSKDKTLLQKMQEICPYHIAKYVQWYLSDQKKRCKCDELCQCDMQFKSKDGTN